MPKSVLQRSALAVLLAAFAVFWSGAHPASAQEGSGRIIREFLTALDARDMDATMALMTPLPELETADGLYLTGVDDVRAHLEALPRPIVIVSTLPWGGQRHEAHIMAGDLPLLLFFQGASGQIGYLYISPDTPEAITQAEPAAGAPAAEAQPEAEQQPEAEPQAETEPAPEAS